MNKAIIFLSLLFPYSCAGQQEQSVNAPSIEYLEVIKKNCPNPDIVEVEKSPDGYVEVEYLCDGRLYEVAINNSSIMYTETKADKSQIPYDKIYRKLEKKYQGWMLDEISVVTTGDTSFLKVEVVKDGIEQNLYFTSDGKWFKLKTILASEKMNTGSISKNSQYQLLGYNLLNPDQSYEMPDLLKEVSGIALGENSTLYCVQDELGAIFEYDLKSEEIKNIYRFTDIGDFEDVAVNKDQVYVLRSDGALYKFSLKNPSKVTQQMLALNTLNIEGLAYFENYVYIACKEPRVNQNINKRTVYRIKDNDNAKIEIVFEINNDEINQFIKTNYPNSKAQISFNPSAIAINPITKEFYILSATDRALAIFHNNTLKSVIPLPATEYFKPEGLSFYPNGDLLISSEGDKKGLIKGSVMLLKFKK